MSEIGSGSWRWIFYLNLPISALALILLIVFLRLRRRPSGSVREQLTRVDWGGAAILIPSVAAIVLALGWGGSRYDWASWHVALPLGSGLAGLVAFVLYQASPWLREPTMPLRLFTRRASALCLAISFLHSLLLFSACYFLPVYFQAVREASPRRSAVMLFPIAATSAPAGVVAGIFITRTGRAAVGVSDPEVRRLLVDGGAYEHATRAFMLSLESRPGVKAEVVRLYVDGLRIVWRVSIAFAVLAVVLAGFVPSLVLREEVKTEYGLEERRKRVSSDRSL
ncbi:hypothetical protein CDD80_4371 [Ophiocordyceps camponoti-rufipedis]|uniref:Major facilitator superfamily (MFS) profile domain-containing protein n=1 Tax=Ophiocordyceps camponoti-rufipedis TaxID=2004952 RepID=A0A2C5YY53_9HYPO|nr:hypothetical protein CDD80_4371 [Ophiocordyceps camponoti-rufipedis]